MNNRWQLLLATYTGIGENLHGGHLGDGWKTSSKILHFSGICFSLNLFSQISAQQILFLFQSVIWGPCLQKQDSGTPLLADFRNWVIRLQSQGTQHICGWLEVLVIERMMVHRPARPLEVQGGKMVRKQKKVGSEEHSLISTWWEFG